MVVACFCAKVILMTYFASNYKNIENTDQSANICKTFLNMFL